MAARYRSTAFRARDIDRALTASALDTAYADGQLSFGEHRLRSERARNAVTLDELHRLVSDLQLDVDLPEPVARRSAPKPRVFLALGSVVIIAAGLALFFATRDSDEEPVVAQQETTVSPTPQLSMPLPADVTPIIAQPFVFDTAAGLDDFRTRYIERFGTTEVLELSIQVDDDNRADVYRVSADGRRERVFVAGGFEVYRTTDLLDPSEIPFDWALVDSAVVAGLIAGTPAAVGVPGAVADWVTIDTDDGVPQIAVTAYDADRRGGRIVADLAGNIVRVSAYSG